MMVMSELNAVHTSSSTMSGGQCSCQTPDQNVHKVERLRRPTLLLQR